MTINRSPSLTEQVKSHLKARIVTGEFPEGRIPPETELAADLGVSRTTIRDALSRLENEGAIIRKQGAGTFVNEPGLQIRSRLEDIWSYEDVLQDHGYTPSVRVLGVTRQSADPETRHVLQIAGDMLVMEKLFLEDRRPVVLTYNTIAAPDGGVDAALPIYEILRHNDRHLAYYLSEIVPVNLDADQAAKLEVAAGTPVVSFQEVGFDQENEPVVKSASYFRDDLLRFRMIRRKEA